MGTETREITAVRQATLLTCDRCPTTLETEWTYGGLSSAYGNTAGALELRRHGWATVWAQGAQVNVGGEPIDIVLLCSGCRAEFEKWLTP